LEELRRYHEEDRGAVARVAAMALGGSVEHWEEEYYAPEKNPRLDPEQVYVIEVDGEIRATAAVLPLKVFFEGKPVPMGGIGAVATHAAYRRRGYAGELMRAALRQMRERSVHLSMLHPFAHAYYRRYGWELATEAISYHLKPSDLPTSPEQRYVRAYRDQDLPRMMRLLEGEGSRHPLFVSRGEGRWRQIFARGEQEVAVYDAQGRVEGYLLYKQAEGNGAPRILTLSELVAETPEAREGLISFAAAFDPLMFDVRYSVPRGEPLHPYLPNSFVDTRINPEFMLRLVSVEGALGLLDRRSEALSTPLVLEVEDDVIPENAGEYTLGDSGVLRGAEAEDRVALDTRQLAQLYAGYLSARQLLRRDLVQPNSAKALELLETLFLPSDPYVSPPDDF
jgi:predicted acetyltransferase